MSKMGRPNINKGVARKLTKSVEITKYTRKIDPNNTNKNPAAIITVIAEKMMNDPTSVADVIPAYSSHS